MTFTRAWPALPGHRVARLYVMYFGMMSMITPPVAIAAFAAAGLAKADPMQTGWAAVRFGWIAYIVPFLFVLSPPLLLMGSAAEIVLAIAVAVAGVWLVSLAIAGYLMRPLAPPWRLAFGISGLLALVPASIFQTGQLVPLAGIAAGASLVGYEYFAARARRAEKAVPK